MLSNFKSDSGSAVPEFVLVVLPISLLVLPLIDLFGMFQEVIVKEQLAYEIGRYASLADVSAGQAEQYRISIARDSSLLRTENSLGCVNQVEIPISRSITFWPMPIEMKVFAQVHCETS